MNGMGIGGNEMDQSMGKQLLRHSLDVRPKFSGQTHGRHLAETAHVDHLIIAFWVPGDFIVPLRMGDDGDDPVRDQLEKDLLPLIRKTHKIKFDHQVTAIVVDRHDFPVFTKLKKVRGEMDIGPGKNHERQFGVMSSEFGV